MKEEVMQKKIGSLDLDIAYSEQEKKLLLPEISCIAGKEVITLEKEG